MVAVLLEDFLSEYQVQKQISQNQNNFDFKYVNVQSTQC